MTGNPEQGQTWKTPYGNALWRTITRVGLGKRNATNVWYRLPNGMERACGLKAWRKWVRTVQAEAIGA